MATTRNSAQWVALRMLRYIGVTSLDPKPDSGANPDDNRTYLAEGDLDDIVGIQTAALQDIFDDGPADLSQTDPAANLHASATLILNVTQGASAATIASGWQAWMKACSVLVAGDGYVNEIVAVASGGTPGSLTLRRPYPGVTASGVTATVFGNGILLDASIKNVIQPVETALHGELSPCADRAEFDRLSGCHHLSTAVRVGCPAAYFVEARFDASTNSLSTILRVAPAPQVAQPITFRAKLNPPIIIVDDLGTSTVDPGRVLPIPGGWVESIFLPYCLQRFTGSPLFKNESAKPEIARQFQSAKAKLAGFKPQIARVAGSYAYAR